MHAYSELLHKTGLVDFLIWHSAWPYVEQSMHSCDLVCNSDIFVATTTYIHVHACAYTGLQGVVK